MDTMEIAKKLVELCRQGKNDDAVTTLFSSQAVSVEAFAPPGGQQEAKGVEVGDDPRRKGTPLAVSP